MYTINNKSNISSIRKLYTKIELQKLTSGSIKKKKSFSKYYYCTNSSTATIPKYLKE